jgi:hypothetical protein
MMEQQIDPMSEQPHDPQDQLDRQDTVSADHSREAAPDVKQAPQETPPMNRPADMPGASVNQQGQQDQEAAQAQRPQPSAADMAAPPAGSRPSPDGPSAEAGNARPGTDATSTRTAERQESGDAQPIPLLSADVAGAFLVRWDAIQATFVDEPRRVVEQADSLVADVMQRIAETMAHERMGLERQWAAGDAVSTEDLRLALQHYRSFFKRLLSA